MGKRRKNDFYPTPGWATEALLKHVNIGISVLEPCNGADDITNILLDEKYGCLVTTNDLDEKRQSHYHLDATKSELYTKHHFDWVVTNPPFSQAIEILETAHKHNINIAMLLRLSFLEPTAARSPFLTKNPPNKILVLPRISFTGDGKTDSVTCAWLVWDNSQISWIKVEPK